jgi:lipoate-protein ligase B
MELCVNKLLFCDLGLLEYSQALKIQNIVHQRIKSADLSSTLLLVEHPAVLTLGKRANKNFVLSSELELKEQGISLEFTDRGGEVTAHMPGQLVVYPIVSMRKSKLGVKQYVAALESAVIAVLGRYNIVASIDSQNPGVWVGRNKICAIGIRIKEKISMHGIAFNIDNEFDVFNCIVPCGLSKERGVTSLLSELSKQNESTPLDKAAIKGELLDALCSFLGYSQLEEISVDLFSSR